MAASETKVYFPLQDILRLIAVAGVVWLHVTYHGALQHRAELGRFAVPFFAGSAVYLACGSLRRHPALTLGSYAAARFRRVYVVFLAWSVIYLGVRWVNALFVQHTGTVKTSLADFFWNGEAFQLWFLPFIFLASIAAFVAAKLVRAAPWMRLLLVMILVPLALDLALSPVPEVVLRLGYATLLGYNTLPACFMALALALVEIRLVGPAAGPVLSVPRLVIGGALILMWLVCAYALGMQDNRGSSTVAGFGFLLVSLAWSTTQRMPVIAHLGSLAFGIYLAHLLFVETIYQLLPKLGWDDQHVPAQLVVFAVAFAGSIAMVELLHASKWTRWLAG